MRARAAAALAVSWLALLCPAARAAGAPQISDTWVEEVKASSAQLWAKINPNGAPSTYRFEVISQAAFEQSGYLGAKLLPASGTAPLGAGTNALEVNQFLGPPLNPLAPATSYRYRVRATSKEGSETSPEHVLSTQEESLVFKLPDQRGWELVSPIDKGGGAVGTPEALFGGGEFQAAQGAAAITYGSATSFEGAKGAPPVSQYLSRRTAGGWSTEDVSAPLDSAAYGDHPDGAPFRLFSADLSAGLLFGGLPCRGGIEGCPAPNPVLAGSGAPSAFMAYYLRDDSSGGYSSLLSPADLAHTSVTPEAFSVSFAAASPDLSHVVLSSCAALSANATEVPAGPGKCDPSETNLYEHSASGLALVNLLPGETTGTPGAQLAAPVGALSEDGSRVYFTSFEDGHLYLREGNATKLVSTLGSFQTASADGSAAFLTESGHLYRYLAKGETTTDLTPGGGVVGVLGGSADGTTAYYQDATGIERWREAASTLVAAGAEAASASDYPPATATARVSADAQHLAFLSTKKLTAYDNGGHTEAYLWGPPVGGGAPVLTCVSCNPTGERAQGDASIPGAPANGSTHAYRPRALSADGQRLFFQSSDDLAPSDTDNRPDVYQWEAEGKGDCERAPGCLDLISSGRAPEGASFVDASADGADVYFTTDESLVGADPGSIDLYDARVGGGLPEAPKPIPCIADACQALPPTPEDPDPGTLVKNAGNPLQKFFSPKEKKKHPGKKHHRHKGHHKAKKRGMR